MPEEKDHILVYGTLTEGFRFVGAFTRAGAYAYAQHEPDKSNIWVAPMDAPANLGGEDDEDNQPWTLVIQEYPNGGFNWDSNRWGGGFAPTRAKLVKAISQVMEVYLPERAEERQAVPDIERITYRQMVEASYMLRADTAMKALYEAAGFPNTAATEKSQQWFNSFNGKRWPEMAPEMRREKLWTWIQDEQCKPFRSMEEALRHLPEGVTAVVMDPNKPEVVHNAIAEALGEAPHTDEGTD